ncbi:MAG TPA: hypothetical protein VFN10_15510 [Thermoanaerobaculia bacterium]|nr:hypothetical protein [Thermoanaerobaculia bacterium]
MRKSSIATAIIFLGFLLLSCASSDPAVVPVIGAPEDLVPLAGEWTGTYDSYATSRSGSITFHLTENPAGAHGDVLMVPKQERVYDNDAHRPRGGMISSASVLSIEFVRIANGEISGKIAPYPDPEVREAMLETQFTGRLNGDSIEGTFVTYSDHGVAPMRGSWRVRRKSA